MLIYNVEDDASIRELVKYALESVGYEVVSFERAEEMLAAFEQKEPTLVVLDIMLPGMDGIEALRAIRAKSDTVKVILLTAKVSEVNKVLGLDNGADDYITKPFSVLELQARVRAHLRSGSKRVSGAVTIQIGEIVIDTSAHKVTVSDTDVMLTYKEFELIRHLAKNMGKVVSRDVLLRDIWGYDYVGESRTVDIHIKNLRAKLGKSGDRIKSVRGVGYILG